MLEVDDNGWLCGDGGELIAWVPPGLRANIQSQSRLVINPNNSSPPTVIDFGDFVGEQWVKMFNPVSDGF